MKLLHRIALSVSAVLFGVMSVWGVLFYFAIMQEVNDEVDDALEGFSEVIITRTLAGMDVPRASNGTNNQYYIREVSEKYVDQHMGRRYIDSTMYIQEKHETEPARVLKTFFRNKEGHYLELLVATPTIEKEDLRQAILEWILVLWVSLLVIIVIVNIGMFRRNMKPLYVLLRWLDKYRIGRENEPLKNDTSIVEFRKLNEAAIRNANRSEELFLQQKQFIGNASHEIQTPLAICRNRLELLLENEDLTEMQMNEIVKVLNTLNGITRLNKSLLLLSKIENGQFGEKEPIDMNILIHKLAAEFEEVYAHLNITVSIIEKGRMTLRMNESLAGVLVTNLLKNAFVHNKEAGKIEVVIEPDQLIVRNTGTEEALDKEHIFKRFHHTRKREGSTGLGLAILDSICKLYGFNCVYEYHGSMHSFMLKINR